MEPDLDRLLDYEASGSLFPQYEATWPRIYDSAGDCARQLAAADGDRPRIALKSEDPESFAALFISLCRKPVDLFLFNPLWSAREEETAMRIAQPHWLWGDFQRGEFSRQELDTRNDSLVSPAKGFRVMIATGGSSGQIRFAIHDWASLAAAVYGFQQHLNCDTMASNCVLPLYHVSGFMQLVRALLTVGKIVFGSVDTFPVSHGELVASGAKQRFLSLVPTQLERLLRIEGSVPLMREYDAIFVGGGPASVGLLQDCRDLKLPLAPTYGMTETAAQVATLRPERFLKGENTLGKPLPHARIDIVSEEDARTELEQGERGLVRIVSQSLFRGYWGDRSNMREQSIVTSDIGYKDPSGSLVSLGRSDGVIISGGEKINLREVELCIEESQLVRDVVAFGVEDREWGQQLAVAYVPKEDFVSEEAIREAVSEALARYKIPKVWIREKSLPRNEAGKLSKERLLSMARR